ncbi:MAG TPA: hypothetical protein PKX36_08820 [Candidatus Cloacimonadota bacterium]|nr:hypothetical protein [Candidatus Cloacimonadota bacterium]
MKLRHLILPLVLIMVLISGCERPVKAKEHKAISAQIDSFMVELFTDAEKLQTKALENYLDEGPSARFFMGAKLYRKPTLLKEIKRAYEGFTSQKLVVMDPKAIVVSRNAVVWTAQVSSLAIGKDGVEYPNSLSETWLWQKKGEYWTVTHFSEAWVNK